MYAFYVAVGSTSLLVSLLLMYQLWIERLLVRIDRACSFFLVMVILFRFNACDSLSTGDWFGGPNSTRPRARILHLVGHVIRMRHGQHIRVVEQ